MQSLPKFLWENNFDDFCPISAFLKLALSCLSWGEGVYLSGIPQKAHVFMSLRADPPDLLQMLEREQRSLVNKQTLYLDLQISGPLALFEGVVSMFSLPNGFLRKN